MPRPDSGPVPSAELRRIAVPAAGFDAAVYPLPTSQMGDGIDPPLARDGRPSLPVRVSDRGVRPASRTGDTVYVGCHTSDHNPTSAYPCNALIRSEHVGDTLLATTDAGTIRYRITTTRSIPKEQFAEDDETWSVQPNRLVFVMCDVVGGRGNHANWVIYATVAP